MIILTSLISLQLLFLLKLSIFIPVIRFPLELRFFVLICLYYAVMIHLLLFALGTWLYSSNFHDTRFQARIFVNIKSRKTHFFFDYFTICFWFCFQTALVFIVYFVLIILVGKSVSEVFDDENPLLFDRDIWEDSSDLPVGIGIEVYLLLSCLIIAIAYIIWNKRLPPINPHTRQPRAKPDAQPQKKVTKK